MWVLTEPRTGRQLPWSSGYRWLGATQRGVLPVLGPLEQQALLTTESSLEKQQDAGLTSEQDIRAGELMRAAWA